MRKPAPMGNHIPRGSRGDDVCSPLQFLAKARQPLAAMLAAPIAAAAPAVLGDERFSVVVSVAWLRVGVTSFFGVKSFIWCIWAYIS